MSSPKLHLEELFRVRAESRPTELPQMSAKYYAQYEQLLNIFRTQYYPKVDAGLAANSKDAGLYTAHDSEHFDEVVHQAGALVNAEVALSQMTTSASELNAYELYILLVAIRVHDVGNIYGREHHEKKCFQILREVGGAAGLDDREKKAIANIAQAHGGRTSQDSKDTIGQLDVRLDAHGVSYRPRLLAGIVRIADEICENKRRAATVLMRNGSIPTHNEIYHQYAASLTGNHWRANERALHITFEPKLSEIERAWGCELRAVPGKASVSEAYLLDEIFSRLEKMDLERRYCNMFTREVFTIDAIKVKITVIDDESHDPLESIKVPELSDRGYPEKTGHGLRLDMSEYCGPEFGASLRKRLGA